METQQHVPMEVIYARCAGLDVHKKTVVVCVRKVESGNLHQEVRTFGTMTRDLLAMSDWLAAENVTHLAMESTGVFWKPIWNLLESRFQILLVNPYHMHQVPGRKTDVKDCEWIAQLLQCGLLRASFVPPPPIRELRDLTRYRTKLAGQHASTSNRIQKVLEDANIKLASDVLGVSGRAMLKAILDGEEDTAERADRSKGKLRNKKSDLVLALEGRVTDPHRYLLSMLLEPAEFLEKSLDKLKARLEVMMRPFSEAVPWWDTIPGVDVCLAQNLVAELGPNRAQFPSAHHAASWAGMCPGNNESAGQRKSGKTTNGNRWLRRSLVQAAWAARRKSGTALSDMYHRLVGRRGKKKAIVAVGHAILISAYEMLKHHVAYPDLGPGYLDQRNAEGIKRNLVKRLEKLGHKVIWEPLMKAA